MPPPATSAPASPPPALPHGTAFSLEELRAVIAPFTGLEGALLPALHALQNHCGHVPAAAHALLQETLGLTRAELHGVLSFYHDFRSLPVGRHRLQICRAEACQAMGAEGLAAGILSHLGLEWHGTSPDGRLTVEPVFCLGLCACAPAVMLDGRPLGRVTGAELRLQLAELPREAGPARHPSPGSSLVPGAPVSGDLVPGDPVPGAGA